MDVTRSNTNLSQWFAKELECRICSNLMSNPKTLNCLHSFCFQCLDDHGFSKNSDRSLSSKGHILCPICSKETVFETSDFLQLKSDVSASRVLESLHNLGLSDVYKEPEPSSGTNRFSVSTPCTESDHEMSATSLARMNATSSVSSAGACAARAVPTGLISAGLQGSDEINPHSLEDSIEPLRSSGFEHKYPLAPNQFHTRQLDSSNISLAISSIGNTATNKTDSDRTTLSTGFTGSTVSSNPSDPVNVVMERFCEQHPHLHLEFFCRVCKMAICHECLKHDGEHYGHEHCDLQLEAEFMRRELKAISREGSEALAVVDRTLQHMSLQDENSVINQLDSIEEEIKATAKAMMTKIFNDRNRLLKEVKRMRQATSSEQLEALRSEVQTGSKIATLVNKRGDAIDVANVYKTIVGKMQRVTAICAEGGSIDRFQEIAIRFAGNNTHDIELGIFHENRMWEIQRKIEIPLDKRGHMQGMTSLPGGRIAVGYDSGGIDIISANGVDKPERILDTVNILDLISTSEGNIITYPMFGEIKEVTLTGRDLQTSFDALSSKEHVSLSRGNDGRVLFGYSEHGTIHEFNQSGGSPLQVIPMQDIKPQQIDITRSGKVVAKDKTGVKILDLRSQEVTATIAVDRGQFAYSTCDIKDNVYVAKVEVRKSLVSIGRYNDAGELLESVCGKVKISTNAFGRHWLRLVSLSPSLLAVCDGTAVILYRRNPSILELATELQHINKQ